uniref:Cytochrome P450 n=1 Tax=Marmota marmota marmota TaxID=9994 RepID=A0A8C6A450_MARMA
MFTVYPGPWPVVILCGHELVKEALVDRADEFSGRGEMATLDKNFQGHGVAMRSIEERIQEEAGYLLEEFRKTKDKIHKEINQVIGPHRTPCVEDRVKIPYTDAIIQEFQRLTDIVPMGVPHNVIQDTHFQGYFLPKGTDVFPVIGSVLKDPKYFRYPDAFYPEHFLDEQGCFKKNEPFMPFSSGKRICLGEALARMELFLYFTSILQNFSLRSLVPVADIDITPRMSGFGNIPPTYKLCLEAH